jgi:16S rRNA (cytosine967-C5)-methyltransferase
MDKPNKKPNKRPMRKSVDKGTDKTGTRLNTARSVAWEILNNRTTSSGWVEDAINARLPNANLNKKDERLCRELCFGVVKMQGFLDYCIQAFLRQKQPPVLRLMNLLRLGAYQLLLLDKVPEHAAVHETVEMAKRILPEGQVKMINAILRTLIREGMPTLPDRTKHLANHLSIRYSFPGYVVQRWLERYGETMTESMLAASNESPVLWARVNTTLTDREKVIACLAAHGIQARPGTVPTALALSPGMKSPYEILELTEGMLYFQDQGSQLLGYLVDPKPNQECLDLCSAPGGKTTHLAEMLNNTGMVWAHDVHPRKLTKIQDNAKRLQLKNISVLTTVPSELQADHVLVDAPCSGLGTLRRHAELRWRLEPKDHIRLAQAQSVLLEQAAAMVKLNGHLVYATCTTEPEENEDVIHAFLSKHSNFEIQPGPGSHGHPVDKLWQSDGFFRTYADISEMDGMFAARLVRRG